MPEVTDQPDRNASDALCSNEGLLPPFTPAEMPRFSWADREGSEVVKVINEAYDEVVHWKRNVFFTFWGGREEIYF